MAGLRHLTIFAAIVLLSIAGCSGNQGPVTVGLGETFTIGVGQSARIPAEGILVTFNEVVGDSRCPQNVTCVWEGVASSRVTITYNGAAHAIVLSQLGHADEAEEAFMQYKLTHSLNPYPIAGEETLPEEYRLTMTVTK